MTLKTLIANPTLFLEFNQIHHLKAAKKTNQRCSVYPGAKADRRLFVIPDPSSEQDLLCPLVDRVT